jgi:N-carbamoylputrescine amidase
MSREPEHFKRASRPVTVAALQMACGWDAAANLAKAEQLVREAAARGAQIILLPELFETPYFCIEQDVRHLNLARGVAESPAVRHFSAIAQELSVVLPISFFERAGPAFFNSIAILDADGTHLGTYRKSHIPNGPGYQEKNYFSPGNTGFKVWPTRFGRIGVGICWDQWFPETARSMALLGAELLFFPTAIGTEPPPALAVNSREHWQRTQQGHAAANLMPLVAANRYGLERSLQDPQGLFIRFYGSSFIADATGAKLVEAPGEGDAVLTATFDLEEIAQLRNNWFVFRARRPGDPRARFAQFLNEAVVLGAPLRIIRNAQQEGRMDRHPDVGRGIQAHRCRAHLGDGHGMPQQSTGGGPSERDHELGRDETQLLVQPPVAGLDLSGARFDVQTPLAARLELEVFDRVAEVDRVPLEARVVQRASEYRASGTHERMTLQILRISGRLADEHQRRRCRTLARNTVRSGFPQCAAPARIHCRAQFIDRSQRSARKSLRFFALAPCARLAGALRIL